MSYGLSAFVYAFVSVICLLLIESNIDEPHSPIKLIAAGIGLAGVITLLFGWRCPRCGTTLWQWGAFTTIPTAQTPVQDAAGRKTAYGLCNF